MQDINRHRSDAEQRIAKVPVVEVEGNVAVCDGGGGALGHPLEYIQLDTVKHHTAQTCKYCGIQYKMKEGFHDHH
jgi:NADH dehydrogenase (ubiquinone) Fe-S protein 6